METSKGDITINLVGTMHPAPDTYDLLSKKSEKFNKR